MQRSNNPKLFRIFFSLTLTLLLSTKCCKRFQQRLVPVLCPEQASRRRQVKAHWDPSFHAMGYGCRRRWGVRHACGENKKSMSNCEANFLSTAWATLPTDWNVKETTRFIMAAMGCFVLEKSHRRS